MLQISAEEVTRFLELQTALTRQLTKRLGATLHEVHGLDLRSLSVLYQVHKGALYPSDVAEALHVPNDMVSRALEPLAKHGLIERRLDPTDGRRVQLHLTPAGRQVASDFIDQVRSQVGDLLARLTPDTRAALLNALQTLADLTREKELVNR